VTQLSLPAAQSGEHKLVIKMANSNEMNVNMGGEDFDLMERTPCLEHAVQRLVAATGHGSCSSYRRGLIKMATTCAKKAQVVCQHAALK
jgi:hypothetical protein